MTDDELHDLLLKVFRRKGMLIPTTEEEVAEMEKILEESDIEIPESLKDPTELFDKITANIPRCLIPGCRALVYNGHHCAQGHIQLRVVK